MTTPTHAIIAHRAHQLWQEYGQPEGRDQKIWFTAEGQLTDDDKTGVPGTPAIADRETVQAEIQKREARAPQVAHHTGPKTKPAQTGKPLWPQVHSS
ncbi:MAG: DUF2934 domain-containing protein [Opitutaceae bacterium]|nr:DUF2934 domain-containing protein [Opitutaceae bacterium]